MEKIKKEFNFGTLQIKAEIGDTAVALITNNQQVTNQIYLQAKKAGKVVYLRGNVIIQKYPGKNKEEILDIVNQEIRGAYEIGNETKKKIEEKQKEE